MLYYILFRIWRLENGCKNTYQQPILICINSQCKLTGKIGKCHTELLLFTHIYGRCNVLKLSDNIHWILYIRLFTNLQSYIISTDKYSKQIKCFWNAKLVNHQSVSDNESTPFSSSLSSGSLIGNRKIAAMPDNSPSSVTWHTHTHTVV